MRVLALRLFVVLLRLLPHRLSRSATRVLARLRYRRYRSGIRPKARNIRERLHVSCAEAEAILKRSFELELAAIGDGARFRSLRRENVSGVIEVRGLERLDEALAAGRGAVMSTGHVAGFAVFFAALGVLGYQPNLIRLRAHSSKGLLARWAYERYNKRLERHGCTTLWMDSGAFDVGVRALNALRRNEVVISPIDLTQSGDNARVTFLGAPALMPRGLAVLADISGAPVLDFFVYRGADGRLVATIGEAWKVDDVDAGVQRSATALEQHVREHPADWSPWHVFDDWRTLRAERPTGHLTRARQDLDVGHLTAGA